MQHLKEKYLSLKTILDLPYQLYMRYQHTFSNHNQSYHIFQIIFLLFPLRRRCIFPIHYRQCYWSLEEILYLQPKRSQLIAQQKLIGCWLHLVATIFISRSYNFIAMGTAFNSLKDTLAEPHKVVASLHSLIAFDQTMLICWPNSDFYWNLEDKAELLNHLRQCTPFYFK